MKCKCGHAEEDHDLDTKVCSECEECEGFDPAPEDEETGEGKPEVVHPIVAAAQEALEHVKSAPPVEYTVVVELAKKTPDEPRRLIKFPGFQQALASVLVPHSSKIWVSRATFLANADALAYEDLVPFDDAAQKAVSDDVTEARMTLKSRMYDRLLDLAWTPEQAAEHIGVRAQEGKMARKKKDAAAPADGAKTKTKSEGKRSYAKLDPKTKITKLVDKNPAREGSATAERFALIRSGMTVEKYVEAGGKATFLTYFEKAGHIKLDAPA